MMVIFITKINGSFIVEVGISACSVDALMNAVEMFETMVNG